MIYFVSLRLKVVSIPCWVNCFTITYYYHLLGVQKQTTNSGVLLKLGKWPMSLNAKKIYINNWERITVLKQANIVLKPPYEWTEENNMGWPFGLFFPSPTIP